MPTVLRAILLMIAANLLFTFADLFLKLSTQTIPLGMVTFLLGCGVGLFFLVPLLRRKHRFFDRAYLHPGMAMRCIGESVGIVGIIVALAFSDLALVTALLQSLPLVLTGMGILFLREVFDWQRLVALLVGLVGVLIIIRPGMAGFDLFASITLIGVAGYAIRDFGTRIMPPEISTEVMSFYGSIAVILTGLAMMVVGQEWQAPDWKGLGYTAALIAMASLGTLTITLSLRLGEFTIVSPFRYVRVVFGMGVGILILGETVDLPSMVGSAIVVAVGLYSWMRERNLALAPDKAL